jgi:hypothetical protein
VVNKRQQRVNSNYHNRARKLDENTGFHNGKDGPSKTLKVYGVEGGYVVAPVVGAFAEMSSHVNAIADLIASLPAGGIAISASKSKMSSNESNCSPDRCQMPGSFPHNQ